jgi:hypothetical protein
VPSRSNDIYMYRTQTSDSSLQAFTSGTESLYICFISAQISQPFRISLCHHPTRSACVRDPSPRRSLEICRAAALLHAIRVIFLQTAGAQNDEGTGRVFPAAWQDTVVVIFVFFNQSFLSLSDEERTCPSSSPALPLFPSGATTA